MRGSAGSWGVSHLRDALRVDDRREGRQRRRRHDLQSGYHHGKPHPALVLPVRGEGSPVPASSPHSTRPARSVDPNGGLASCQRGYRSTGDSVITGGAGTTALRFARLRALKPANEGHADPRPSPSTSRSRNTRGAYEDQRSI